MANEVFAPEVLTHPVTGDKYQRSRTSSRRVVQMGNGGNASILGIEPVNFMLPFLHSEFAKDYGVEDISIAMPRLVRTVTGI